MHMPILQHKDAKSHSTLAKTQELPRCLLQKSEQISMYNIQRSIGISFPNDTGDVYLRSTLRDHLDVDLLVVSFDIKKKYGASRNGEYSHDSLQAR